MSTTARRYIRPGSENDVFARAGIARTDYQILDRYDGHALVPAPETAVSGHVACVKCGLCYASKKQIREHAECGVADEVFDYETMRVVDSPPDAESA
jgi:hypothetical protein